MSQLKLDDKKLENMIEAILFASGDAVEVSFLADKLATKEAKIVSTIEKLKKKYSGDSGLHIVSFKNKVQFGTNPAYAEQVAEALSQVKEKALSKAVLETLAIVAYRQPITRLEIEDIRGVNSDYAIEMLEKNKLVEVVGRKESVGKPLLFATTESFLKRFGLKSLEQLPNQEILLER
ncbi:MAG: SMC-Scp complex subunit ScpB, partial [Firmicutes bacterium]|nr:SMC-Scp complex subunit ScpB [Bacillota bacterium]